MNPFLLFFLIFTLSSLPTWSASTETFTFGRFGPVAVYHNLPHPSQVILLVSGARGWNQEAANVADALASLDALVVGIDLSQYLKTLGAAEETCSYPGGDFAALSKFVQLKYGFPVVLRTVPKLLLEAPQDVITLPGRVFGLVKALSEGMLDVPTDLQALLTAIVTSETPKSPVLLQKALDALYDFGTFRSAADLVWELTAPDNQSLRLALLLFARANGVPERGAIEFYRELVEVDMLSNGGRTPTPELHRGQNVDIAKRSYLFRCLSTSSSVAAKYNCIVLSTLPEARVLPSGLKATDLT
jgi:hypothetical protein